MRCDAMWRDEMKDNMYMYPTRTGNGHYWHHAPIQQEKRRTTSSVNVFTKHSLHYKVVISMRFRIEREKDTRHYIRFTP
jgi:hypothetical protein